LTELDLGLLSCPARPYPYLQTKKNENDQKTWWIDWQRCHRTHFQPRYEKPRGGEVDSQNHFGQMDNENIMIRRHRRNGQTELSGMLLMRREFHVST